MSRQTEGPGGGEAEAGALNVYRLSRRTVAPGTEDQIKELMTSVQRKVRRVPGLLDVEVLVSADDPQTYNVLTRWENQAVLDDWVSSELCQQVRSDMESLLAEPLEVRTFRNFVDPVFLL